MGTCTAHQPANCHPSPHAHVPGWGLKRSGWKRPGETPLVTHCGLCSWPGMVRGSCGQRKEAALSLDLNPISCIKKGFLDPEICKYEEDNFVRKQNLFLCLSHILPFLHLTQASLKFSFTDFQDFS